VLEPVLLRQREPLGQGVEALAELDPSQQRFELRGDRGRGHWPPPLSTANSPATRANRPAAAITVSSAGGGSFSAARSTMRVISATSTASHSQRPRARLLDPFGSEFLGQPQQPVDGPHLGPRQRRVQQRAGIGTHRGAVAGGLADELVQIPQRVGGDLARQVGLIGGSPAGRQARVDLDHLPAVQDLDQLGVGPDGDLLADQFARHRIQRPGDLDVMIPMDLGDRPGRQVIACVRGRSQHRGLQHGEHLSGTCLDRAVDPHPRPHPGPGLGLPLRLAETGELLAGLKRAAHERHHALHARPVGGLSHPGRIDEEPARLGVLQERGVDPRIERIRLIEDRLQIVGDDHSEDAVQEGPGRLAALDDILEGLTERRPHEHVARDHRSEDQRPHRPPPARLRIEHQPHPAEVDLQLLTRLPVDHRHRGRLPPVAQLLRTQPVQRPVGPLDTAAGSADHGSWSRDQRDPAAVAGCGTNGPHTVPVGPNLAASARPSPSYVDPRQASGELLARFSLRRASHGNG
jgi:hypothetical protein